MAFDEQLAERIRETLSDHDGVAERHMFGGLAFMVDGHMCVGVVRGDLMVRVGPEQHQQALGKPHARTMDFTGRPMKGFVYVAPDGVASDRDLEAWLDLGLRFVASLPPK